MALIVVTDESGEPANNVQTLEIAVAAAPAALGSALPCGIQGPPSPAFSVQSFRRRRSLFFEDHTFELRIENAVVGCSRIDREVVQNCVKMLSNNNENSYYQSENAAAKTR